MPEEVLGHGTFGVVSINLTENPIIARKYIPRYNNQHFDRQFRKEAEALKRLRHPNIIEYYGFEEKGDFFVISMFYCQRVIDDPTIIYTMTTVLCWSNHLLSALISLASNENRLTHRDIKPAKY